jgi:hypothetical protein
MNEQRLAEIEARLERGCGGHEIDGDLFTCSCFEDEAIDLAAEVRRLREQMRLDNTDPDITLKLENQGSGHHADFVTTMGTLEVSGAVTFVGACEIKRGGE